MKLMEFILNWNGMLGLDPGPLSVYDFCLAAFALALAGNVAGKIARDIVKKLRIIWRFCL